MKNSTKLVVYLAVTLALLLVYLQARQGAAARIRDTLETTRTLRDDLVRTNQEVAELRARFGNGADVPAFVEKMHRQARRIGITDDYELSSNRNNKSGGNRNRSVDRGDGLSVSRMKISLHGEYRDVAEYLRLLQEDDSPKKLSELKMVQDQGVPRLTLDLELYSYRGKNGV